MLLVSKTCYLVYQHIKENSTVLYNITFWPHFKHGTTQGDLHHKKKGDCISLKMDFLCMIYTLIEKKIWWLPSQTELTYTNL